MDLEHQYFKKATRDFERANELLKFSDQDKNISIQPLNTDQKVALLILMTARRFADNRITAEQVFGTALSFYLAYNEAKFKKGQVLNQLVGVSIDEVAGVSSIKELSELGKNNSGNKKHIFEANFNAQSKPKFNDSKLSEEIQAQHIDLKYTMHSLSSVIIPIHGNELDQLKLAELGFSVAIGVLAVLDAAATISTAGMASAVMVPISAIAVNTARTLALRVLVADGWTI